MKIYILWQFGDGRKLWANAEIVGYFTNKEKLKKAIDLHREELGIEDVDDFNRAFYRTFYDNFFFDSPNNYMDCGLIETTTANEYEFDF